MNNLFEFKQEDKITSNYKKYGLKSNPFPMGGQPSKEDPYIPVSENIAKTISQFVDSITLTKKWQGLSIVGDNGTGKTRLMYSIESGINTQLKFSNAIYINDPPPDALRLFQKIIGSSNLDSIIELFLANSDLLKLILGIFEKSIDKTLFLGGITKATIKNEKKLIEEVSEALSKYISKDLDLHKAYAILLLNYIISTKLKQEGTEMMSHDFWITEMDHIKRYISGENVNSSSLEKLGINLSKIGIDEMEKHIFPTFLEFNKLAGKKVVYALIDEFQFVIDNVSKTKIATMLDALIAIIQTNQKGFSMVLACLPDSWNYASRISNSFSERFSTQVNMPILTKEVGTKMVSEYLRVARINKDIIEPEPFTETAISNILILSNYNIRKFLHFLGLTLNLFIDEGKGKSIDESFVNEAFKNLKQSNEYTLWESGKN